MNLSATSIRTLRQRLGWSMAEMARQMGCTTELIGKWESGSSCPEADAMNQLHYLQNRVEKNSDTIQQKPQVEIHMESRRLSQVTHRDLLKDS
jgi:transcriptional regulator with XRE-family HTH domain